LVFVTPVGTQLDEANFRKNVFWRALSLAGLRRVCFHDFRHSFGSLLIEQGEDLNYVKEQLGHHSITLSVDVYGHRFKDDRRAVDALDEMPNGSKMVAMQAEIAFQSALVVNGTPNLASQSMNESNGLPDDISGGGDWRARTDLNRQPSDSKSDALSS